MHASVSYCRCARYSHFDVRSIGFLSIRGADRGPISCSERWRDMHVEVHLESPTTHSPTNDRAPNLATTVTRTSSSECTYVVFQPVDEGALPGVTPRLPRRSRYLGSKEKSGCGLPTAGDSEDPRSPLSENQNRRTADALTARPCLCFSVTNNACIFLCLLCNVPVWLQNISRFPLVECPPRRQYYPRGRRRQWCPSLTWVAPALSAAG